MSAEIFFNFVFLKSQLYTGAKTKDNIIANIIESNIGLRRKKDKTKRRTNIDMDAIFFK
jgi:hypothetical protein